MKTATVVALLLLAGVIGPLPAAEVPVKGTHVILAAPKALIR